MSKWQSFGNGTACFGADTSVAGVSLCKSLFVQPNKLLPSSTTHSRAVNGSVMQPVGKLPVTFSLGATTCTEEFYIYPEVSGTLLSWKAARNLHILPECYPSPIRTLPAVNAPPDSRCLHVASVQWKATNSLVAEFPSVFDGNVEGEEFPFVSFYLRVPVPFVSALQGQSRMKLQTELELLEDHHPLIPILNSHCLDEILNPRLQRLCTRIMAYNFTADWIKGSLNSAPDAVSLPSLRPTSKRNVG